MSIKIIDNFEYQGPKFNFDRDSFKTKSDMKSYPETSVPPHGFTTYCEEDDKEYTFDIDNEVDEFTGKWREKTTDAESMSNEDIDIAIS